MKVYNLALASLIPVLASSALARPGAKVADDADPIAERSRVTAFVYTDDGLRVQCWEVGDLLPSVPATPQHCDSRGTPRWTQLGVGKGGISGVGISTWPSSAILYPPPSSFASAAIDFGAKPNLFTVKDGLIFIEALAATAESLAEDSSQWVFADINGDDWFYFEDTSSSAYRAKRTESSFNVKTISGSDTTLINFKYDSTPQHKVLHEGRCNFAGLKPVEGGAKDKDLDQVRMTVQEL